MENLFQPSQNTIVVTNTRSNVTTRQKNEVLQHHNTLIYLFDTTNMSTEHYYSRFEDFSETSSVGSEKKRKKHHDDDDAHRPQRPKVSQHYKHDTAKAKRKDRDDESGSTTKRKRDDEGRRPQKPKLDDEARRSFSKKRSSDEPLERTKKRVKIPDHIEFPESNENRANPIAFQKASEVPHDSDDENASKQIPLSTETEDAPKCTLSMYNYTLALLKGDVKKKCEQARKSRILEKWEYARLANANDIECEGDMRCRLMDMAIAWNISKGLELSPAQNVCARGYRLISLAQYYGDSIQFHLPRLLAQYGCSELHSEILIFMARRQGKTTFTSLMCACELVTQPLGHDICVYSNNGRASRLFLMMMYKFVRVLSSVEAGFGGQIKNLNKNEGMSYTTRWGTVNKATAFPAEEQHLRGTGSTETTGTVIIDEINYCHPSMVNNIIAPTLVRKRVKFAGITTISGFDSFVTPLANARYPDGRKVMLTLNFEMVCEDCKAKGEPEKCKCLMADLPHWHLSTQLEKLEILLASNLDTYMREMKNLASDSSISSAFNPKDVAYLKRPECVLRMTEISAQRVFVAIDPACGGDKSRMAIISAIYSNNEMIVSACV